MMAAMSRARVVHVCSECGTSHPKWSGQCSGCGDWNTLVEDVEVDRADVLVLPSNRPGPARIGDDRDRRRATRSPPTSTSSTGSSAAASFAGSVTLARRRAGHRQEHAAAAVARHRGTGRRCTSPPRRAPTRCGGAPSGSARLRDDLWLHAETSLPHILDAIDRHRTRTRGDRLDPDRARPCARRRCPEASARFAAARIGSSSKPRNATSRSCSSATSPRTAGSPGHACSEHVVDTVLAVRGRSPPRAAAAPGLEAPVRADERARPVRDVPRRARRGARSVHAVPRRSTRRRRRLRGRADDGGAPPDRRRGAGTDQSRGARGAVTTQRPGPRRRPAVDADGGARPSQPHADRRAGRLRVHRGRRQAQRARSRPRGVPRRRQRVERHPLPADLAVFGEVGLGGELRQVGPRGAPDDRGRRGSASPGSSCRPTRPTATAACARCARGDLGRGHRPRRPAAR